MTDTDPDLLLDLDALAADRKTIKVDGTRYEIYNPMELSVIETHRFGRWVMRIRELQDQDGKETEDELEALTEKAARAVFVDIPEEVFDKIKGAPRSAVVEVFSARLLRSAMGVADAMHKAAGTTPEVPLVPLSTGETAPRGWLGSLGSILFDCWKSIRSLWSKA